LEQILAKVGAKSTSTKTHTIRNPAMIYRSTHPINRLHRLANRYAQSAAEPNKHRIAANIIEVKDAFHIQLFLAGFSRENIQIKLENNELVIAAKRDKPQLEANWISREVQYGDFERRFTLADTLQKEAINAQFENGLLKLIIPKKAEEQARTIEIN
jgi:HSP20 family protein